MLQARTQNMLYSLLFHCNNVCANAPPRFTYRGAVKSLAQSGRKQANVPVRIVWISSGALPCQKKKLDSSRLVVVEIARVPVMLPSFFPSWSG